MPSMVMGAAIAVAILAVGPGSAAPAAAAVIECGEATIAAGEIGQIAVRLRSEGREVAGVQNDINLPWGLSVVAGGGTPGCRVNPAIDKNLSAFGYVPWGEGEGAAAVRAIVVGLNPGPIADGAVLYTCEVAVDRSLPPGIYTLRLSAVGAATALAQLLDTKGVDCRIHVAVPAPLPMGAIATTPIPNEPPQPAPRAAHPTGIVQAYPPATRAPIHWAATPRRSGPTATPTSTPETSEGKVASDRGAMAVSADSGTSGCQVPVSPGGAAGDSHGGIALVAALAWVARRSRHRTLQRE